MNKTVRIKCPKCERNTLRKSWGKNMIDREFFCDHDHLYFGIHELVNEWSYDAGDLVGILPPSFERHIIIKYLPKELPSPFEPNFMEKLITHEQLVKWWDEDTVSTGEPVWGSLKEKDEAYEVVNEMLMGIESWETMDDYNDLRATERDALGIGIQ